MRKKVLSWIAEHHDQFSKSFKKIADYVAHNQSIASFISINDLAEKTGTSPATITRFTRKLGFKGYPEFQAIFQNELERQTSYMKELKTTLSDTGSGDNVLANLIAHNIELLQGIDVRRMDLELEQAVKWLGSCRKIYILGARGSYSLAYYFYFMLKEFKEGVDLITLGATDFTDKLLYIRPEDVLLSISFYPYTHFTIQVTEFFKENGNKIITVTDKEDSSLGNLSDLVLTTKSIEQENSLIPGLIMLQALLLKLGVQNKKEIMEKLDRLKVITDRFNLYTDK
ncbi:MAG: MurR/RpiR family transcriptional regulator [Fusobacteriaceae bacterium]|jgi:DNA-binding MurR/RpiR family transcriptional regulator|nr:MurR/RpiR family transcriptional regulator [Fusobacteriaceae bacterium]